MSNFKDGFLLNKNQLEFTMDILGKCTENYVFIFDLDKDVYWISENALKIFAMPSNEFGNATEIISRLVYPEDLSMLTDNIADLKSGKTDIHDLVYRWLDKEGNFVWINCVGRVVRNIEGREGACVMLGRIARIGNRNIADNVTGLFAENKLKAEFNNSKNITDIPSGMVLRVGIDNFKDVNSKYGHKAGDDILKDMAAGVRALCMDARYYKIDGDEFVILFNGQDISVAKNYYNQLRNMIEADIARSGYKAFYTISAGVVSFEYSDSTYETISAYSAFALKKAKELGKNRIYVFKKEDFDEHKEKIDLQERLRKSVNNSFEGFQLHYQPIIDVKEQRVMGAEALLRYYTPETGYISPAKTIPILEESGLIIPVGKWVFTTAMRQALKWQEVIPDFKISINLSYVQIRKSDVVTEIMNAVNEIGIRPETVQFEFTESGIINVDASMKRLMRVFSEAGISMALDDFGTGYSSLSYLQELKVNVIKLDRGFIEKAAKNDYNFKLIKHIRDMSNDIGMQVCFEGIETNEELEKLKELKPDCIQGYLYGKPIETVMFSTTYIMQRNV